MCLTPHWISCLVFFFVLCLAIICLLLSFLFSKCHPFARSRLLSFYFQNKAFKMSFLFSKHTMLYSGRRDRGSICGKVWSDRQTWDDWARGEVWTDSGLYPSFTSVCPVFTSVCLYTSVLPLSSVYFFSVFLSVFVLLDLPLSLCLALSASLSPPG
jgi:hypothetical protein